MDGSIPEGRLVAIDDVSLSVDTNDHPWHAANRAAVDGHWEMERVERPFLFNGTVMMHRGLCLKGGRVEGVSHAVPYANLMYFLSRPQRDGDIWHLFGTPVIISRDNAVVLIKMSERTANPGRIYSPSGSLDLSDIRGGVCDLAGNMRREVAEEADLDLDAARADAGMFFYHSRHIVAAFRCFRFDDDARAIAARIDAHIATQDDPEVVASVVVRGPDDITDAMPDYMAAMVRHHFENPAGG
jgi:8-oxo-dGTP pyrophosphatase MutT (NUDIX family)